MSRPAKLSAFVVLPFSVDDPSGYTNTERRDGVAVPALLVDGLYAARCWAGRDPSKTLVHHGLADGDGHDTGDVFGGTAAGEVVDGFGNALEDRSIGLRTG